MATGRELAISEFCENECVMVNVLHRQLDERLLE